MATTFKKSVKGKIMEAIFDNSPEEFNVKYYNNLSLKDDEEYDENKTYQYEINIRHAEGTDAKKLFNQAIQNYKSQTN